MKNSKKTAILLIVCPDRPGLVAEIAGFVHQHRGNIVYLDQHTDIETQTFLMRIEWELDGFGLERGKLQQELQHLCQKFNMQWNLYFSDQRTKIAIFVSKYSHCLYDLLVRHALGEIEVEIPLIISNHEDLKEVAKHFSIPFHVISFEKEAKIQAERQQIQLLEKHHIDLIVLARYMQVLSPIFVQAFPNRIINIHHSFLPAFKGGRPYHQAYARGVKVIGATSHYVTEELDQGPIIHQSVMSVSHQDQVEDLIRKGRDQEKSALAYAVRMHTQHRILTYNNKTVVFE